MGVVKPRVGLKKAFREARKDQAILKRQRVLPKSSSRSSVAVSREKILKGWRGKLWRQAANWRWTIEGVSLIHAKASLRSVPGLTYVALHRHQHHPSELAFQFVTLVKIGPGIPNLRPSTRIKNLAKEIEDWDKLILKTQSGTDCLPISASLLKDMLDVINSSLFFGTLGNLELKWEEGLFEGDNGAYGVCDSAERGSRRWSHIRIDPADLHTHDGTASHATSIFGTLVHECIHAFFNTYSCAEICKSQQCFDHEDSGCGKTGHGPAWVQIATHVEDFLNNLEGVQIDLGVPTGYHSEYFKTGYIMSMRESSRCHPRSRFSLDRFCDRAKVIERRIEQFASQGNRRRIQKHFERWRREAFGRYRNLAPEIVPLKLLKL